MAFNSQSIEISGTWKTIAGRLVSIGNAWKSIVGGYVQVGGVWKSLSGGTGFQIQVNVGAGASFTLPLVNTRAEGSLAYNCTVYWGDGTSSSVTAYNSANATHTYTNAGSYTVEIQGTCEGWSFNNGGSKLLITSIVYWGDAGVFNGFKYLKAGFYGCANLTSLGTGAILASGTGILTDGFWQTFQGCTSLTSIPAGLFQYNTAVSTSGFYQTFYNCTALTSIPAGLFQYNTAVSTYGFYGTFRGCTSLTSIPTDLFRYNTAVSTSGFCDTFYQCTALTSIPTDLFRYNTLVSTSGFYQTFMVCTSLTSIPTDLFRYNTLVSTSGFYGTFYQCSALTSIPAGLFQYNTAVSTSGFYQTFYYCTHLTSIPTDLFRYNTAVSTLGFYGTFLNCTLLASVPGDLFLYNTACTSWAHCFDACPKLQVLANIFYEDGSQSTRFLNQSIDFTNCFNRTSFTGSQGTAPDLWNCTWGTGTPTSTNCFGGAGNSATSLTNYSSIPTGWGHS